MKRFVLICLVLSPLALFGDEPSGLPVFQLRIGQNLLSQFTPALPKSQSPVSQELNHGVSTGIAFTSGTTTLSLAPCSDCVRIEANLDLSTRTATTFVTTAHPEQVDQDVRIEVVTTGITQTTAHKAVEIRPSLISTEPTTASSKTALTIHGASASVQGGGIMGGAVAQQARQQAVQQAEAQRADRESMISENTQKKVCELVDKKATAMISSMNRDYKQIFYDPLFVQGRLPGVLALQSDTEALRMQIRADATPGWETPPALPEVSADADFSESFSQALLNRKLRNELGGKVYDDLELAAYFQRQGVHVKPRQPSDAPVVGRFCQTNPITVAFTQNTARITFCFQALGEDAGLVYGGAHILATYELTAGDGHAAKFVRQGDARFAPDAATVLPDEARTRFQVTFADFLPADFTVPAMRLPIGDGAGGSQGLSLIEQSADGGWLVLQWAQR